MTTRDAVADAIVRQTLQGIESRILAARDENERGRLLDRRRALEGLLPTPVQAAAPRPEAEDEIRRTPAEHLRAALDRATARYAHASTESERRALSEDIMATERAVAGFNFPGKSFVNIHGVPPKLATPKP